VAESAAAKVNDETRIAGLNGNTRTSLISMPYELFRFKDGTGLARQAADDWWQALLARKSANAPPYIVGLSGGRITRTFYNEMVTKLRQSAPENWDIFRAANVHFFWADERWVPPDDVESNYALARELLFEPLKIPDEQIHRVHCEAPEPDALQEVIGELRALSPFPPGGQPVMDLVFLGMGEDGHTASLFPGEPESVMNDPAIYRAVTAVKPPPRRVTLGYGAIAAARQVWVLISGGGKEQSLKQTLSPAGRTPLARVLQSRKETRIYTDVDAHIPA
jgi:6-phosphogluconolactonase